MAQALISKYTFDGEANLHSMTKLSDDRDFLLLSASGKKRLGKDWSLGADFWLEKGAYQQNMAAALKLEKNF